MNKTAKYLKRCRVESGLSQKDVSRKLKYKSSQFISNWERGVAYPPPESWQAICNIIDGDVETLKQIYMKDRMEKLEKKIGRMV